MKLIPAFLIYSFLLSCGQNASKDNAFNASSELVPASAGYKKDTFISSGAC
jgi:hypothetical protein